MPVKNGLQYKKNYLYCEPTFLQGCLDKKPNAYLLKNATTPLPMGQTYRAHLH